MNESNLQQSCIKIIIESELVKMINERIDLQY